MTIGRGRHGRQNGSGVAILFIFLVLAFYCYKSFFSKPHIVPAGAMDHLQTISGMQASPCENKERCISVYVTPWCGTCRISRPFIQALRAHFSDSDKVGVQVVVGQDSEDRVLHEAEQFGGLVQLDYDDTFHDKLGVSAFPTWIVWDENQKIKTFFPSGAPSGAGKEQLIRYFLDEYLDMKEY